MTRFLAAHLVGAIVVGVVAGVLCALLAVWLEAGFTAAAKGNFRARGGPYLLVIMAGMAAAYVGGLYKSKHSGLHGLVVDGPLLGVAAAVMIAVSVAVISAQTGLTASSQTTICAMGVVGLAIGTGLALRNDYV